MTNDDRHRQYARRLRIFTRLLMIGMIVALVVATRPIWNNAATMNQITGERFQSLNRAATQSYIATSVNGKLRIKISATFPNWRSSIYSPMTIGDFHGDGGISAYAAIDSRTQIFLNADGSLNIAIVPAFQNPPARIAAPVSHRIAGSLLSAPVNLAGTYPSDSPVTLPHRGGDWVVQLSPNGASLIAVQRTPTAVAWETPLPASIKPERSRLGVFKLADGTPIVWLLSGDGSALAFFDSRGELTGETLTRSDIVISPGDFDAQPGEEILATYSDGGAALIDETGSVRKAWKMKLPGRAPVAALPALLAPNRPGIRLEFREMGSIFYDLDGNFVSAPANEITSTGMAEDVLPPRTLMLPDGRRIVLFGDNLLLLTPDGRTQDVLESQSNSFSCIETNSKTGELVIGGTSTMSSRNFIGKVEVLP